MAWRLALDMGTNSLGWAAFTLTHSGEVEQLLDAGVRIFHDGREPAAKGRVGDSLAVERRLARGIRRNRDRTNLRKQKLLKRLIKLGLIPGDKNAQQETITQNDPYCLRAKAVDSALQPYELGRVLMQLSQRRGFKSNRKSDGDDETGTIKPKISELKKALGEQTLGQWMHQRLIAGKSIRFRGEDGDFFANRDMYLQEFDIIQKTQQPHHRLSDDDWNDLRNGNKAQAFDGLFYQRPLKPVERGRCQFFTQEFRAHKDLPIAQDFRILNETANLQYYDDSDKYILNDEQRSALLEALDAQKTMSFGSVRKLKNPDGTLLFPRGCLFNLEEGPRDKLKGNATAIDMRKPELFGDRWDGLDEDDQNDVVEMLHDAEENDELINQLMTRFELDKNHAKAVSKFKLSPATSSLSRKFMSRCADVMHDKKIGYVDATTHVYDDDGVFLHHSHTTVDQLMEKLPYYGELLQGSIIGGKPTQFDAVTHPEQHYGKINNPTVHVALNQLRKLVNVLSKRFGPPAEIHVELGRDLKKSAKVRNELAQENSKFAKANEKRADIYRELNGGQNPSGLDLKKIRLWEELGKDELARQCPYTGKIISAAMLFNGEAEIEHILPFSKTLDNGASNLTISMPNANQLKGDRTPYDAFSSDQYADQSMVWSEIADRAKSLPKNKRWRFDKDAMERFNKDNGFIARQLTDNAHIAKTTKRYLGHICDQNKIVTIPGGLTAMMRGKWYLNTLLNDHNFKERNDHRHHIIDAFVVGLTDRGLLQKISTHSARGADDRVHIKLPDITALRNQLEERLGTIIVSYKPDHGTTGKLFNETAYGIVAKNKQDADLKGYNLVTRKKIDALSEEEIHAIRNPGWRNLIVQQVEQARIRLGKLDKNALAKVLAEFGAANNIKTIRILVSNQSATVIPSAPYKAYAPSSFVCVDIWQLPKGKVGQWKTGEYEWHGAYWSYDQCGGKSPDKNKGLIKGQPIHPAAKFITRLFKNDLIEIIEGDQTIIMKVAGFSTTNNKIDLRPQYHTEGKRKFVSINVLWQHSPRKLMFDESGKRKG